MKVLVCTLGKNDDTIYNALRIHEYNQLILIMEKEAINDTGHKQILEFESANPNRPKTVPVNPEDFWECYKSVQKVISDYKEDEVILNISGGTKLLSMASILCAFNNGVPAYHYEVGRTTRLPVFQNFTIRELISNEHIEVLQAIKNGISLNLLEKRLKKSQLSIRNLERILLYLRKKGFVTTSGMDNKIKIYLTEKGKHFKELFLNFI